MYDSGYSEIKRRNKLRKRPRLTVRERNELLDARVRLKKIRSEKRIMDAQERRLTRRIEELVAKCPHKLTPSGATNCPDCDKDMRI